MILSLNETACLILERLSSYLSDASVDYECLAGVHTFVIRRAGARFKVGLPEQMLLRKQISQLEELASQVVARVRSHNRPQPAASAA
jgi:predicted DNA-binding protein (UPF0278 family)